MPRLAALLLGASCVLARHDAPARDATPAAPGGSYAIPAAEIAGFDLLLNAYDRHRYAGDATYETTLSSIRRNLRGGWTVDDDPYPTNQLLHPYQGSIYHGFARSAGLGYWQSAAYTFGGSLFWEVAGETTPPSRNDQVASGVAGSFLGEALYRMANLVLERERGPPGGWRELAAAAISPATGFNRHAFGSRFDAVLDSRDAPYYGRLLLGGNGTIRNRQGPSAQPERSGLIADFALEYGLPGRPHYSYDRPFDYFGFRVIGSTGGGIESLETRGLLYGTDYAAGGVLAGIWGLYGSYDYVAPQLFRVSSSALSLGTTAQLRLPWSLTLQGSALAGVGYAAAGTLNAPSTLDYHYGSAPQLLAGLRLVLGHRAALELSAGKFFVGGLDSADEPGRDDIERADITLTLRVQGRHGIALSYLWSQRKASLPGFPALAQERGTLGIFYTLLGKDGFGVAE